MESFPEPHNPEHGENQRAAVQTSHLNCLTP